MDKREYGLDLTVNSKVGMAFSLPRNKSCINATEVCKRLCYGKGIRYQSEGQKAKRERNFRTVEYLLTLGGPEMLAENLLLLVDHARPLDWLTTKLTGQKGALPWSLRVHDVGDFHSIGYVQAWSIAVQKRPDCLFWFYTRSFRNREMLVALSELAGLDNCQGWISLDSENYQEALAAAAFSSDWKVAILQEAPQVMPAEIMPAVKQNMGAGASKVVSFPYHFGGRHVEPILDDAVVVCPQVQGVFPLQSAKHLPKPCQQCKFCLP